MRPDDPILVRLAKHLTTSPLERIDPLGHRFKYGRVPVPAPWRIGGNEAMEHDGVGTGTHPYTVGVQGLWLKRDDLGLFQTHKARGIGVQIELGLAEGARGFSISSSGNAAIATAGWCRLRHTPCLVFLSNKTETAKILAVREMGGTTVVTPKPKNFSRYAARYGDLVDLRPSNSPSGATGYQTLSYELLEQLGSPPTSVFVFTNSALTLIGLYEGFVALRAAGWLETLPRLHSVQCTANTTLAQRIGAPLRPESTPTAGALGAQTPPDLERAAEAITASGGKAWMVINSEIDSTARALRQLGISAAPESAAALAGAMLASKKDLGERPVVMIAAPERATDLERSQVLEGVDTANDYADVRLILDRIGLGRSKQMRGKQK